MSFQPVIPLGGYRGWLFLKRTQAQQQASFNASAANRREDDYFRANIGRISSAEELVLDRRLLRVALTAFGLEADLDARAFIRKIMEGGTISSSALANKLADKRYLAFATAFDFSRAGESPTKAPGFAEGILARHAAKRFEIAVGEQSETMRLALNAETELAALTRSGSSDAARWYSVMGNLPLRKVFETAFGLPSSFAKLDIEQQLKVLRARAWSMFGSSELSQFAEPGKMEKLLRQFVIRADLAATGGVLSPRRSALELLLTARGA